MPTVVMNYLHSSELIAKQTDKSDILRFEFKSTRDAVLYDREVYNGLQFLGDIGALYDALRIISSIALFRICMLN